LTDCKNNVILLLHSMNANANVNRL